MTTQTADARRIDDKLTWDAYMASCPTRTVMATVGDKWAALIINALADGSQRHGQLRVTIAGVSQKMLTQTLRELERDGLLTRAITATVPVRVDYDLTALGRSLLPLLQGLKQWSEANIEQILAARDDYDNALPTMSTATNST